MIGHVSLAGLSGRSEQTAFMPPLAGAVGEADWGWSIDTVLTTLSLASRASSRQRERANCLYVQSHRIDGNEGRDRPV